MEFKFSCIIVMCLLLTIAHFNEGKRTLSGRSRTSSSSNRGSARRTQTPTQTHYSPPPASKPAYSHPSNAEHVKLTYGGVNSQPKPSISQTPTQNKPPIGWNVPNQQSAVNKPSLNAGPPPAYSPHNVAGGAKTNINEPPPAYKPNYAAPPAYPGNNQQPASYPRQTYNTASGAGYPQTSGSAYPQTAGAAALGAAGARHNTGYRPHNSTGGFGGGPIYAQTARPLAAGAGSYHPAGSVQPGFYPHQTGFSQSHPPAPPAGFPAGVQPVYHPSSGGGFAYPQQATPVFAGSGVQPGFYPAGTFPARSSSGPGFGTGLLAGAVGGAVLGHVLTPTHTHQVVSGGVSHAPADNQDRVIIINNNPGQPATVTNAAGQPANGVTVVQNGPPATNTGTTGVAPDASVPLAPFPSQQQAQPNYASQPASGVTNPATGAASGTYPNGIVPLAPFGNTSTTEQANGQPNGQPNVNGTDQPQYATYCVPVMVNVTDPNNTANVTQVEQVYCYNVLVPPPEQQMAPVTNSSQLQQQPDLMQMPGNYNPPTNDITSYPTQKTSTASLAANSNIKSGSKGIHLGSKSIIDTILMTVIAFSAAYCMH